jgi:hypothetical protein
MKNYIHKLYMASSVYTFSIDGNEIKMNDSIGSPPINVPSAVTALSEANYIKRFLCDMVKDAHEDPAIGGIVGILKALYPGRVGFLEGQPKNQYKNVLHDLENEVFANPQIESKQTILNNVLKTSTVGSNTRISDATNVFWESGMNPANVCSRADTDLNRIGTPAGILDSLNKGMPGSFFPNKSIKIVFDQTFTNRLGFIDDLEWSAQDTAEGKYDVTIKYKDKSDNSKEVTLAGTVEHPSERGDFSQYVLGNKDKNEKIPSQNTLNEEKKKLLLIKELGDVAQVWMYMAYVNISKNKPTDCLMVTTDSVVYLFCALLNISCIYTGARAGVESGCCTLKHYLAGEIDFGIKIQNMIKIEYESLNSNMRTINQALLTVINEITANNGTPALWFYCEPYGRSSNTKILINKTTFSEAIITHLVEDIMKVIIREIERKIVELNQINDEFNGKLPEIVARVNATDTTAEKYAIIDTEYKKFLGQIVQFNLPQIITRLKGNTFCLNNVSSHMNIVKPFVDYYNELKREDERGKAPGTIRLKEDELIIPVTIEKITPTEPYVPEVSGGKKILSGGANEIGEDEIYRFEFKILIYILQFVLPEYTLAKAIDYNSELLPPDFTPLLQEKFAVLYDYYANQINIENILYYDRKLIGRPHSYETPPTLKKIIDYFKKDNEVTYGEETYIEFARLLSTIIEFGEDATNLEPEEPSVTDVRASSRVGPSKFKQRDTARKEVARARARESVRNQSPSPEPSIRDRPTLSFRGLTTPGLTPVPEGDDFQGPQGNNTLKRRYSPIEEEGERKNPSTATIKRARSVTPSGGKRTRRNKNRRNKRTRQQRKKTRKNKTLKKKKGKGKRTRRISI